MGMNETRHENDEMMICVVDGCVSWCGVDEEWLRVAGINVVDGCGIPPLCPAIPWPEGRIVEPTCPHRGLSTERGTCSLLPPFPFMPEVFQLLCPTLPDRQALPGRPTQCMVGVGPWAPKVPPLLSETR